MAAPLRWTDEARLKWLFLDLNSYFASVEQQDDPALRAKPIIVAPVMSDTSFAIAASYEAKAFGVRTGTRIGDAKRMCPGLICVPARHDVYVEYHHRIIEEVERHVPVSKICSIDEVACALTGPDKLPQNAVALARRVKAGIVARIGECLSSSIGLAPSRLLAKIATDLQKPDGLTLLGADALPGRLLDLELIALPGIGPNMRRRLNAAGIRSVSDFWALTPGRARKIWGGIGGERFWYALHGLDPPEIETRRASISHSHVLAPELRAPGSALNVARRLMAKTASRLRRMGYRAGVLTLFIRLERGQKLESEQRFPATFDSFALLRALDIAQHGIRARLGTQLVRKIGVTLSGLTPLSEEQPDLFGWTPASDEHAERVKLSDALDRLNTRYGRDTVSIGAAARLPRYTGTKVAFNRIPDRAEFRE